MYSPHMHRRPIDRVVSWPALPRRVSLCVNYFLVKIFSASKVVYEKASLPTFRVISLLDLRSRHGAMFCHPPRACGVASHEGVLGELFFFVGRNEKRAPLQTPTWEARA